VLSIPFEHGKVGYRQIGGQGIFHCLKNGIEQVEVRQILHSRAHSLAGTSTATRHVERDRSADHNQPMETGEDRMGSGQIWVTYNLQQYKSLVSELSIKVVFRMEMLDVSNATKA